VAWNLIKRGEREGFGMLGNNRQEASRKRVAVIGLGRFGTSVARVCHELGYDVTVIDIDEDRVAEAADYATLAAQADGSDEEALLSLGVDRSVVAVVGQGQNIEESISCALILKRIGVPWVIAKAETEIHGEILTKVGADRIVFPESEAGDQIAHSLEIRHLVAYMNLSHTCGVARMEVPRSSVGQTMARIETARPGVSVLLIQRSDLLLPRPAGDEMLLAGDIILVAGLDEAIDAFADS
jgi:trk system potassium uptake protein